MAEQDDWVTVECSRCGELCDVLGPVPDDHLVVCQDCEGASDEW